jgi:hypothetical protein
VTTVGGGAVVTTVVDCAGGDGTVTTVADGGAATTAAGGTAVVVLAWGVGEPVYGTRTESLSHAARSPSAGMRATDHTLRMTLHLDLTSAKRRLSD